MNRAFLAVCLVLAGASVSACSDSSQGVSPSTGTPLSSVLGEVGSTGFERALSPRPFVFPADHGPHPSFRTEWWYFTGNLEGTGGAGSDDGDGDRYGFQLTFFRSALSPSPPPRASRWAANQIFLAHFAVTDGRGRRFHSAERYARGALDLAGANASPFEVWVGDWRATSVEKTGDRFLPLELRARARPDRDDDTEGGEVAIALKLTEGKPAVLQGDRGLSVKSAATGNASFYYSMTRLPATGTVTLGGRARAVVGDVWLDREWSTSALSASQVGWDWFALQLADGRDLMFYQLRRRDGTSDPASAGSLIARDGSVLRLRREDVRLEPVGSWSSPRSGARYPAAWRLAVPSQGIDVEIRPLLPDQELEVSFRYWEGAVEVRERGALRGRGYVEMTGYDERR